MLAIKEASYESTAIAVFCAANVIDAGSSSLLMSMKIATGEVVRTVKDGRLACDARHV
jgi:hypothetical protein